MSAKSQARAPPGSTGTSKRIETARTAVARIAIAQTRRMTSTAPTTEAPIAGTSSPWEIRGSTSRAIEKATGLATTTRTKAALDQEEQRRRETDGELKERKRGVLVDRL